LTSPEGCSSAGGWEFVEVRAGTAAEEEPEEERELVIDRRVSSRRLVNVRGADHSQVRSIDRYDDVIYDLSATLSTGQGIYDL
jgi:hypothetical protein